MAKKMNTPKKYHNSLCRDCLHCWNTDAADRRCPNCGSPKTVFHPELGQLSLAHIDCDSFYASIEKRDNPELRNKPVIVGGEHRGVVAAACYVARLYGVRSAMPMFQALQACPNAVVVPPDMQKYATAGRTIRRMMLDITPLVEPLSIDEAFLDLTGTERLHGRSPAASLALLAQRIEQEVGVTASIGLSYNKFLAKIASDLEKPRGFAVIGRDDASKFLASKPASIIWGVGKALNKKLEQDGIRTVADLLPFTQIDLQLRYGAMGKRLYDFARGKDDRKVDPTSETKSISAETTFATDINSYEALCQALWPLCEKVASRFKRAELAARTVTLKLKTAQFKSITRSRTLHDPTQLAETFYRVGCDLLQAEADGKAFRLLGIGGSEMADPADADPFDLADPDAKKRAEVEKTIDAVRAKLGDNALIKGRSLPHRNGKGNSSASGQKIPASQSPGKTSPE